MQSINTYLLPPDAERPPSPLADTHLQTANLQLIAADIVHLLQLSNHADLLYHPATPLFFQEDPRATPQPISRLLLDTTHYRQLLLTVNTPAETIHCFPSTSNLHRFLVPKNHPLLLNAPPLPSFFHDQTPFLTTTTTTLTIPQSLDFVHALTAHSRLPYTPAISNWSQPLTLTLRRTWPTTAEPHVLPYRLNIALPSIPRSTPFSIVLSSLAAPLTPQPQHTPLLQNLLINLLLDRANLKKPAPFPTWLLFLVELQENGLFLPKLHSQATTIDAIELDLCASNFALLAHPFRELPSWLGSSFTFDELEQLPLICFDTLFQPTATQYPTALHWVQQEYQRLQRLQDNTLRSALAC